jgi:hypothetical protein
MDPGQFAKRILLPILKSSNVRLKTIASSTGLQGVHAGKNLSLKMLLLHTLLFLKIEK